MLLPQKHHRRCYIPKPQHWDNTQRAIGYLGQFLQYASKPIVEWVKGHQSTRENKQQFHNHHQQERRISYPVDHQVRWYLIPPKSYPSHQL